MWLMLHPKQEFGASDPAARLGVPLSTLHREVVRLDDAGLIISRTLGRRRLLRANAAHPAAPALTQLLEVTFGPRAVVAEEFAIAGAEHVLIFGPHRHPHGNDLIQLQSVEESQRPGFPRPLGARCFRHVATCRGRTGPGGVDRRLRAVRTRAHRSVDQVGPAVIAVNDDMVRNTLNTHVLPVVARGQDPIEPTRISRVNERRRHIDVPVLGVIGGSDADDHIRLVRDLIAEVPYGREVVIPDTAHYPNLEEPRGFNSALRDFLDDLGD